MNAPQLPAKATTGLTLYGVELPSRMLIGTAQYPSPSVLASAVEALAELVAPGAVSYDITPP